MVIPIDSSPMYKSDIRASQYIRRFVDPVLLKEQIDIVVKLLQPQTDKFDAIAFTGMSGTLIGPPVALALGKSFIMVRKPDTSTHSMYEVEGDYGARRYIILDDFRQTGDTEDRIVHAIKRDIPGAEYVGFVAGAKVTKEDVEYHESKGTHFKIRPKMEDGLGGDSVPD